MNNPILFPKDMADTQSFDMAGTNICQKKKPSTPARAGAVTPTSTIPRHLHQLYIHCADKGYARLISRAHQANNKHVNSGEKVKGQHL